MQGCSCNGVADSKRQARQRRAAMIDEEDKDYDVVKVYVLWTDSCWPITISAFCAG